MRKTTRKQYTIYLCFMLLACGGALLWQLFLPQLGGQFTSWGEAPGWQREIALWNVGLIAAILYAVKKRTTELLRLMTLQSMILCWALGINHLAALLTAGSSGHVIHVLGVLEVMLLGGIWGTVLWIRGRK